ncbi:uncharacterized protein si:ch211-244b2.3 isoform X3 [Polyodon spathula]|uniref:uncharacterized protein si:ch211-244b2.3 isoform X3 n=1 Tax=Polyodon spathula TaxID=7913 RepID=UPI001B7DE79F|nr:uncharacterized protein si:ch211-244b2.3 isoform X3 [Polyodon spathula]
MALQNSTAQVKHYQWMLHDGSQWLNLNHDSVIETHYCQPGAQGIALFTSDYGRIFLDFDKMEIEGDQMTPYRQTSLSPDETEEYLWYFFENRRWHEYGSQGSSKKKASVTSPDIEQQYQINPEGSCTFTIGNMSYSLNFSAMTQSNLHTGMQRRVRRRPKYNSVIQKTSSLASLIQDLSLSSTVPPAGDEGVWREHKANASGVVCSVSNDDIEQTYQQNPQGISQFNSTSRTKRDVRRIPSENQQKSSSLQGMALSSAAPPAGGFVWQFRGEEGVWTEYKTNNACGVVCSITSDDIEQSYQQNPQGQLQFTAGQFSYMLDYSGMFQVNNTLGTKRKVRRILCRNQPKSISLQGMALSSAAPPAGGYVWQFRGEEGVWTEYKTNNACGVVCSITSDDIEQSYQQNPQGQLQFTAGQFSYMLDYSGMFQVNNTLGTKRKVRRILCRNQPKSISLQGMALSSAAPPAGGYVWQFRGEEGVWTEYKTNNACGVVCSITSDDIEQSYQQNPQGQLQFTAGQFSYMLDYSGMFQVNNTLGTKRKVRRILCRNQPKSISLQGMALSSAAPPAGGYVWQFRGEEGVWTEYKTNNACGVVCSITSDDIEQSYQRNPQGQLQFTAGQFSYMLDYSAMTQTNLRTSKTRQVWRLQK